MPVWVLLLSPLLALGPDLLRAPADPAAERLEPNAALIAAEGPRVEVLTVNGTAAPGGAVARGVALWSRYLRRPATLHAGAVVAIDGAEARRASGADLRRVLAARRLRGSETVTVVVWPRRSRLDASAYYAVVDVPGEWCQVVVMHEPIAVLPGAWREMVWGHVLVHELCHALHVPADPARSWSGRHCTDPACVLYPGLDHRSLFATLRHGGPTWGLCRSCAGEVGAGR